MSTPAPDSKPTKSAIRRALAQGDLGTAAGRALAYAEHAGVPEATNALTALAARVTLHENAWEEGNLSYQDYSATHSQITADILNWTDRLPDSMSGAKRKRQPLRVSTFKMRVFFALCITKVIVLAYLFYQYRTGGFNMNEFQSTGALLAPAFAAYISVILADYLKQVNGDVPADAQPEYVAGPLVTFAWWLFPLYAIALLALVRAKPAGFVTFGNMTMWLGLVESVLGGYIGQIVHALFKK